MANYLKFDGVNDQALAVDSAGSWPSDGVMTYEIIFTRGSVALNGGVADAFCPANGRGLYLRDTTFQLYWDFGSFRSTYTFNDPVVEGEDKKLRFEFLSDKLTVNVYEDDILHTVITSNKTIPAASDDVNVGTRYGGSSPCNALIRSIKRLVPSSAADSRFWDADSSDTSNTGQQPVLTEVLNGFDAIGSNMNTDGSDWVVTGEPAPSSVDSSIIDFISAPTDSIQSNIYPLSSISEQITSPVDVINSISQASVTSLISEQVYSPGDLISSFATVNVYSSLNEIVLAPGDDVLASIVVSVESNISESLPVAVDSMAASVPIKFSTSGQSVRFGSTSNTVSFGSKNNTVRF